MKSKRLAVLLGAIALSGCAAGRTAGPAGRPASETSSLPPDASYWVYVGAESADLIHRVRFSPGGLTVERTIPVGESPTEMEGPHGLAITRDGRHLLMTTGHGNPDGKLWRFELGPDTLVNRPISLGFFPASIDVTPDGLYAFAVNFNLHGAMIPSSVSIVYTPDLTEVERIETCTMPHGSRVNPQGTHQYSTCMMDDQLVEIDTRTFRISRRFSVAKGEEGPIPVRVLAMAGSGHDADMHAEHMRDPAHAARHQSMHGGGDSGPAPAGADAHGDHGSDAGRDHGGMAHEASCSPTWAQPSADGAHVFVACNRSDEILEIGAADWRVTRRFPTGRGVYNITVSPDGRLLVATLKQGGAVQFVDLVSGQTRATIKSSITVTHGVVVTPDSRYAFVSNEGVGAEPGTVDVYDLQSFVRVASVPVGQQAGGIAFWKMEQ